MISLTLNNIINGLLTEAVDLDSVLDGIHDKYHVNIKYDDGKEDNGGNSKGNRIIQPFAVGTTKKGNPVLRAFQLNGNSRRGAPNWKFFRLDRVKSWRPMKNKKFNTTPPSSYGEYNRTGDKSMRDFYDNVKFDDFETPLERVRNVGGPAPKMSTKNVHGPVPVRADQQWKKNVFTSQPNSKKYQEFARNLEKDSEKEDNYWDEYEKALNQLNNDERQVTDNGYEDNDFDINDVDFDENKFIRNKKVR